jgi:hypothetical protein
LSTLYNYQFITNKFGLNLRGVKTKYNYTVGLAVQPSSLDGQSHNFSTSTHTLNYIPTARFIYNFAAIHYRLTIAAAIVSQALRSYSFSPISATPKTASTVTPI